MQSALFALGWLIFVIGQAHNSVASTANTLKGWPGYVTWLRAQFANLITRAFFSAIFGGYIVQTVSAKLISAGLSLHAVAVAGLAGYAANALLYQLFGMVPWLRVEVSELAPPQNPTSKGP